VTTPYASEAFIAQLLGKALAAGASDVHLEVGKPPGARVRADLVFFRVEKIRPEDTDAAARVLLGTSADVRLKRARETVFGYDAPGLGRFRVSLYRQRGAISLVMRSIPLAIPAVASLGLPAVATELVQKARGLVVLAGGAGSGKSTTAAALLGHVDESAPKHIVTLEDPIEHLHEGRRAIVSQREVGADTGSLAEGLRAALRQDADIVYAAELHDAAALEAALDVAELRPLVLAGVAAPDAVGAVARLFALGREVPDLGPRLAAALHGVLAQRLLPRLDGSGVVLVSEVLLATAPVREALRLGAMGAAGLREAMEKGEGEGMQTFEAHVQRLAAEGIVAAPAY
jgi:twitching motility protein PilT